MVTGDKESEFTVTDKFIQMISDHISIDASTIDINGIITAMNTHTGPGKTKIDGGIIETNTITADSIKVDAIRSKIFEDDLIIHLKVSGLIYQRTVLLKVKILLLILMVMLIFVVTALLREPL